MDNSYSYSNYNNVTQFITRKDFSFAGRHRTSLNNLYHIPVFSMKFIPHTPKNLNSTEIVLIVSYV